MNNKTIKISFYINLIIVMFTIFATMIMFTGYKFMNGYEIILESSNLSMLKFFTVDSNMLMGIVSFIFVIKEYKILNGEKVSITLYDYILKLVSTTAVALTFFIVFAYLGPISEHGILSMIMNSNLFFHLLIPVLSIIDFILYEKNDLIKFKYTLFGIIPTFIYGIYYFSQVIIFEKPAFDLYRFVVTYGDDGLPTIHYEKVAPAIIILLGGVTLLGFIFYFLNKLTIKLDSKVQ